MSGLLPRLRRRPGALALLCLTLLAGCRALRITPPLADRGGSGVTAAAAPGKHSLRVAQFVFLSDTELKPDQPLFRELADLGEQVAKELRLPPAATVIQVYLFEDKEHYERFLHARHPELPPRRAFFITEPRGRGEDLVVYTYKSDRLREDLRHELTHALLHSVVKEVPLWLDEGLAEYFELPPERRGVNAQHLEQCCHGTKAPFRPDLARLERLTEVEQMGQAEYREAWAWAHLMLQGKPEARAVLLHYLQLLRTSANPGPLQPRLAAVLPNLEEALEAHLEQLDAARPRPPSFNR